VGFEKRKGNTIGTRLYYHTGSVTEVRVMKYTDDVMIFSREEFLAEFKETPVKQPIELALPKQDRYKVDGSDEDYVDITYRQFPWERFVGAMQWNIGKYFDRFGRKDDIVAEAYKIKDYSARFYEKVLLEAEKRKKIDEVV
jgi:hypothetical protein